MKGHTQGQEGGLAERETRHIGPDITEASVSLLLPPGMCGTPPGGRRSMGFTPALGYRVSEELGQGF